MTISLFSVLYKEQEGSTLNFQKRGEKVVDYGACFLTEIEGFFRLLRKILKKILKKFYSLKKKMAKTDDELFEDVKLRYRSYFNEHHVFSGGLINGAMASGLTKKGLEAKYADYLDMDRTKRVLVPAHCIYNELFGNNSPSNAINIFWVMMKEGFITIPQKIFFIKFSLCVLMEKCFIQKNSEKFDETRKLLDGIIADVNNGNHNTAGMILKILGVTPAEMIVYLKENFFPDDYNRYPMEIWDFCAS